MGIEQKPEELSRVDISSIGPGPYQRPRLPHTVVPNTAIEEEAVAQLEEGAVAHDKTSFYFLLAIAGMGVIFEIARNTQ